jgi:hypothetical protein
MSRPEFGISGCLAVDSHERSTQRRRSERVAQSLPVIIRGLDLMGQPFEERTATFNFNLHGCRYASKHHLPKNTWITLRVAHGSEFRNIRARVAWIQRPQSVREFFQVAVELETPLNIWAFEPAPPDWAAPGPSSASRAEHVPTQLDARSIGSVETTIPINSGTLGEKSMGNLSDMGDLASVSESVASETGFGESAADSPLLREMSAQLEQRAWQAVEEAAARASEQLRKAAQEMEQKWLSEESFEKWKEEFEKAQSGAREQLAAQGNELLGGIRAEFEERVSRAKRLIEEIEKNRDALRAENESAAQAMSRVAQARLQFEALEAARPSRPGAEVQKDEFSFFEQAAAKWRERLQSEMSIAQTQWNELLESALDSGVNRIAGQLSERSQEIARETEVRMSERFEELRQPVLKTLAETQETLGGISSALDQELARAKASLAEIEQSAKRIDDFSAQVEASTRDALAELNRRLQSILDAQTQEMGERAEALNASVAEKAASALDTLRGEWVGRTAAEIECRVAPHLERVPQLLREVSTREMQMEEGLRLHRERLRQVSENSQRELLSHVGVTLAEARKDFEAVRQQAVAKWNEELEASGVRASHAAAESIERASHSFEHEARARLQALVEQTVAAAETGLEQRTAEAKQAFASALEAGSATQAERIRQQLDGFAGELTSKGRTQIEQAAEVTAAAFGQVLRGISDQEVEHFTNATVGVVQGRTQELESSATQLLRQFETSADSSLARFHTQMASQLETSLAQGRSALASEFNRALAGYRSERESHQKDWVEHLERLSGEVAGRYEERLDTAGDSWMVSSVRRLNEHGQNIIESLMRSADLALRDSCARFFDGLAETLRDRSIGFGAPSHSANSSREAAEAAPPPPPATESRLNQPGA